MKKATGRKTMGLLMVVAALLVAYLWPLWNQGFHWDALVALCACAIAGLWVQAESTADRGRLGMWWPVSVLWACAVFGALSQLMARMGQPVPTPALWLMLLSGGAAMFTGLRLFGRGVAASTEKE